MNIWLAIALILGVITVYMLTTEIFSVAFKLTGLATNKIKFQVASLFTGAGFTTTESELITNDDKRRKIAVACMYTGHIFSVAIMGLIINVFFSLGLFISSEKVQPTFHEWYFIIFYVAAGLFLLMVIQKIPPVNRKFQKFLESIAINSSKYTRKNNIVTVLDMYGKRAIAEVVLNKLPEYAVETPLYEMGLTKKYAINILSIKRGKRMLEVSKDTMFLKGDTLILFGLIGDIKEAFVESVTDKSTIVIDRTNEISLVNNYGPNALVEVYIDEVPEELVDTKIKDAKLNEKYNIIVTIIKRKDNYIFVDKDTIIQKGDTITLFGPYRNIKYLFNNEDKEKSKA